MLSPLASSLEELCGQIDLVLRSLPEDPGEARRVVTRELEIEPRPEELEAIAKIAHDPVGVGSVRELACTALALHILAERGVQELFESPAPSAEAIGRSALLMSGLLDTVNTLETEVQGRAGDWQPREREYLLEVVDALLPSAEPLIAGMVIAPRLLELIHAAGHGDLRSAVPSLTDEEAALVTEQVQGRGGRDGPGRPGINAVALRTVIDDDLASWLRLGDSTEPANPRREAMLDRLKRDRTAYRFVSRQLQHRQDTALRAGLRDFAEAVRHSQRSLFSTYLELAPVLNRTGKREVEVRDDANGKVDTAENLDRLLRACQLSEAIADSERKSQVSNEELYVKALKKIESGEGDYAEVRNVDPGDAVRERRRLGILSAVAGVLLVACVAVYGGRIGRDRPDMAIAPADLGIELELISAMPVGPMMYAQVSHWTWDDLEEADHRRGLEQLGLAAFNRGFVTVYLTDENNRQLGIWTKVGGAKLSAAPPEPASEETPG